MNFAHFVGFQALSFVDRTVPKKIVIFVGEMRGNPSQNAAFFTKSEHTIKQDVTLSSPVSTVYARNAKECLGFCIIASQLFATLT